MVSNPAIDAHRDAFVLMEQTRPDNAKAVTAMTAVESRTFIDGFGKRLTSPAGITYRTPVGADAFGEVITTITAAPITISGTTYQHRVDISDRLGAPVRAFAKLTGTGAGELALGNTGRAGNEGLGAGWQIDEAMNVGFGNPAGTYMNWNPTQMGNEAHPSFFPGVPSPPPPQPIRDRRMHCGQVLFYEVSGQRSRTCVVPMHFFGTQVAGTNAGESATRSLLSYGHRQMMDIRLNWGTTATVRATTLRADYLSYSPKTWTSTTDFPLLADVLNVNGAGGGYWTEGSVYDLANMGSPIVLPPSAIANVLSGSGGVDNFWVFAFSQRAAQQATPEGSVVGQQVRSPVASDYISLVLRNGVTDWAYAITCRLEALRAQDLAQNPFTFVRDVVSNRPTALTLAVNWDASEAVSAPVAADDGRGGGVGANGVRPSHAREAGWKGWTEYISIGRTAHVMEAIQTLYTSGDLDRTPFETPPPQAVTSNTYWPNARLNGERIKSRVKQLWERAKT
jgi:hypothetical protein